eukprot:CAMPEP_0198585420 /NCGR_PEP_ID=MMETSP1462-20131121/129305_1 /TAXON_ID=1333877 /ORGANISM="Brandtodinium nutriculum, Strain RCC3387" /LENGTH=161 /DNA_ID=CAMNT_0044316857 /DNA_START=193 /DNA_END=678 /DNA_ORIENTATION=-
MMRAPSVEALQEPSVMHWRGRSRCPWKFGPRLAALEPVILRALCLVDGVLPRALPGLEVEIKQAIVLLRSARPPRGRHWRFQALPSDPQKVALGVRIDPQPFRVLVHVVLCRLEEKVRGRVEDGDAIAHHGADARGGLLEEANQLHSASVAQAHVRKCVAV